MTLDEFIIFGPTSDTMIMVEWEDSEQPSSEWDWHRDVVKRDIVTAHSLGFFMYVTPRTICIAGTHADRTTDKPQVNSVLRIPRSAVLDIRILTHA